MWNVKNLLVGMVLVAGSTGAVGDIIVHVSSGIGDWDGGSANPEVLFLNTDSEGFDHWRVRVTCPHILYHCLC